MARVQIRASDQCTESNVNGFLPPPPPLSLSPQRGSRSRGFSGETSIALRRNPVDRPLRN